MEYVMGCRFNQVKYLLEMEPDLSIAEVSASSGFESLAHFSRYFKEKVGTTPSSIVKINLTSNITVKKEESVLNESRFNDLRIFR